REEAAPVGPGLPGNIAGAFGEGAEAADRILVRILGVDRLARLELEAVAPDAHALARERHEVHLDAAGRGIVEGVVLEALRVEVGAQLAVDAREEVQVERRGDAA